MDTLSHSHSNPKRYQWQAKCGSANVPEDAPFLYYLFLQLNKLLYQSFPSQAACYLPQLKGSSSLSLQKSISSLISFLISPGSTLWSSQPLCSPFSKISLTACSELLPAAQVPPSTLPDDTPLHNRIRSPYIPLLEPSSTCQISIGSSNAQLIP